MIPHPCLDTLSSEGLCPLGSDSALYAIAADGVLNRDRSCGDNAFYAIVGGFVGTPLLSICFGREQGPFFFLLKPFFYERIEGFSFCIFLFYN